MEWRLALVFIGALASVQAAAAQQPWAVREPVIDGQSLTLWITALNDDDPQMRIAAVKALRQCVPATQVALKPLLRAAADPDPEVRFAVAACLSFPQSEAAITTLEVLLHDADDTVRWRAAHTYVSLDCPRVRERWLQLIKFWETRRAIYRQLLLRRGDFRPPPLRPWEELLSSWQTSSDDVAEVCGVLLRESYAHTRLDESPMPEIIESTWHPNPSVRVRALELCSCFENIPRSTMTSLCKHALSDPIDEVRRTALAICGEFESATPFALPILTAHLADPEWRDAAIRGLGRFRPQSSACIPQLLALTRDADANVRYAALRALKTFARMEPEALLPSLPLLDDPVVHIRIEMCEMIGKSFTRTPRVHHALAEALFDENQRVRNAACEAAAKLDDAPIVVNALLRCLHEDRGVGIHASSALLHLDLGGRRTVPILLDHILADLPETDQAFQYLSDFGKRGQNAFRQLAHHPNPEIAARALHNLNPSQIANFETFGAALKSDNPTLRIAALASISRNNPWSFENDILAAANDPDENTRFAALNALQRLDPSPNVLRALSIALSDSNQFVQARAFRIIEQTGKYPAAVGLALVALAQSNDEIAESAATLLGEIGPDALKALPALLKRIEAREAIKPELFKVIVKIGAGRDDVVAGLLQRLQREVSNPSPKDEREALIVALGSMGSSARAAVPELIDLACAWEPDVRKAAIIALGQIGRDAKAAIPLLNARLHDENRLIVKATQLALEAIRGSPERN